MANISPHLTHKKELGERHCRAKYSFITNASRDTKIAHDGAESPPGVRVLRARDGRAAKMRKFDCAVAASSAHIPVVLDLSKSLIASVVALI